MKNTIDEFVQAARGKSSEEIYDLFEFDTAPAVRDAIIGMAPATAPEPVRSALNLLGAAYGVWELTDY